MKLKSSHDAHSALEYVLSVASLEGKIGHTTLHIPLIELLDGAEGLGATDEAQDLVLKIRIETSWEEAPLEEHEFEANFIDDLAEAEEETEEGEASEPQTSTDSKIKKSH